MQLIKMVRLKDSAPPTPGTRRSSWKKNFTSTDTLQGDAGKVPFLQSQLNLYSPINIRVPQF